jgi:hypothetical protein
MKYEVVYTQEVTYIVDDSADAISSRVGDSTLKSVIVIHSATKEFEEFDAFFGVPDWLQHELDNGRLGEMIDSAMEYGCEAAGEDD